MRYRFARDRTRLRDVGRQRLRIHDGRHLGRVNGKSNGRAGGKVGGKVGGRRASAVRADQ